MTTAGTTPSNERMNLTTPSAAVPGPDWLIEAKGVRKKYCRDLRRSLWYGLRDIADALTLRLTAPEVLRDHEFWAVDDVSFRLRPGESLALLGRNGAGKSTLLRLLTGQRSLTAGSIATRGRIVAMTELGLGFDPVLTGRENAYVNAAVHGIPRRAFDALIEEVIDFSEIREFIDSAVQTYSSGMKARLGFSVATHLSPDILIVDEVLAVGDLSFKLKCIQHVRAFLRRGGSILLVSHEPFLVQSICNRAIVLEAGRIIFEGTAVEGVNFHFQLGRKQSSNPVEAFGRATLDAARGTNWATPQSGDGMQMMDEEAAPAHYIRRGELSPHRPVAIDLIEVLPEEGEHLRTGSPAKVVLRYRSNIATEVLWGFTFSTEDLQINIASCSKGLDDGCSHLKAGEHYLVCRIPDFPLLAGVYAIRGGIGETESKAALAALGYEDAPCYFTVAASDINWTSNENIVRNNLVAIKIEWDY
jgi:ABC-type polysaccharide/polyol phosphate transport system ATPase subunit